MVIALSTALPLTLAAGIVYGIGYGAFSLSGNVMTSELVPARRASAVNLVNMFFGVGAIVGPLVVSVLLQRTGRGAAGALDGRGAARRRRGRGGERAAGSLARVPRWRADVRGETARRRVHPRRCAIRCCSPAASS